MTAQATDPAAAAASPRVSQLSGLAVLGVLLLAKGLPAAT